MISKLAVARLLENKNVLRSIESYPIFLNEHIEIPKVAETSDAWNCAGLYYRFMQFVDTNPWIFRYKNILDIGCNIGTFSLAISSLATSVMGVDTNPQLIYLAQFTKQQMGKSNVNFICQDAFQMPLQSYNCIFLIGNMLGLGFSINQNKSRAIDFYNKLNLLEQVCVVADLSEHPAHIHRNVLYTCSKSHTEGGLPSHNMTVSWCI